MFLFNYFIIEFLPILKKTLPVVKIWWEVDCIEHLKEKINQTQLSWLNVITFFYISMLVTWWLYQFSISVSNKPCNIESRPDEDLHDPRSYLICKLENPIIYLRHIRELSLERNYLIDKWIKFIDRTLYRIFLHSHQLLYLSLIHQCYCCYRHPCVYKSVN